MISINDYSTFQEVYHCPGSEDQEDHLQCCDGGCCPLSDSEMTTGTIFVIVLLILNVGLILTIVLLCRKQIKSATLQKFRHRNRISLHPQSGVKYSGDIQQNL